MRLLAVIAGSCLFVGGMMLLPSWLYTVSPAPDEQFFVVYGSSPVVGPEIDWPSLGLMLVTVGVLCAGGALLWLVFRLIARLR